MANTGWLSAGAGASGGTGPAWSNPGNITASDDSKATVTIPSGGDSQQLRATAFNPDIPDSDVIDGIRVRIEAAGDNRTDLKSIQLWNGSTLIGTAKLVGHRFFNISSDQILTYGAIDDEWGAGPLTGADVNAPGFGVAIIVTGLTSNNAAAVDHVEIEFEHHSTSQDIGASASLGLGLDTATTTEKSKDVGASVTLGLGLDTSTEVAKHEVFDDGPHSPTNLYNEGSGAPLAWSNPENAAALDDAYATVTPATTSQWLVAEGFDATVPENATIRGIEVSVVRHIQTAFPSSATARLRKAGAFVGATREDSAEWALSDRTATMGGPDDLWGTTWTAEDVNDPEFGAGYQVSSQTIFNPTTARVNHITITVYYSLPVPEDIGASVSLGLGLDTTTGIEKTKTVGASASLGLGLTATTEFEGQKAVGATAALGLGLSTSTTAEAVLPTEVAATASLSLGLSVSTNKTGSKDASASAALGLTLTVGTALTKITPFIVSGDTGLPMVTFTHEDAITVPLPCRVEWAHPSHGAAGQFSAVLPYDYAAAAAEYIRPQGGSLVRVDSQSGSGSWRGIIYNLEYREDGISIQAIQEHVILSYVAVPVDLPLRHVSVSTVAYLVLQAAGVPIAGVADHGPVISGYDLDGATAWSVLEDMMRRSGAELAFDDDGLAYWSGPHGDSYHGILLAPGQFQEWSYSVDILDQVSKVTAVADGNSIVRINPEAAALAHWPAHTVLRTQVEHPSDLVILADSELGRRKEPLIGLTGSVPRRYWDIQTGQHVTLALPKAEFNGAIVQARVLSRSIDERGDLMTLRLLYTSGGAPSHVLPRQESIPRAVRDLQRRVGNTS